jgi:hypothetical protein
MVPKMVAPCGLNFYIFISFHGSWQTKNQNYQPQDEKKLAVFYSHVHSSNKTPFMENPKITMWQQKLQLCWILKLENEMKLKN